MKPRLDVTRVSPKALQAMLGLQKTVNSSGLERPLLGDGMHAARLLTARKGLVTRLGGARGIGA